MHRRGLLACVTAIALAAAAAEACGGTVAGVDGGASDTGAGGNESGLDDSGCLKPPSAPVYACEAGPPDASGCTPWDSTDTSPIYPIDCVVTTTQQGSFCGPVTCNCTTGFDDGGPTWICPL